MIRGSCPALVAAGLLAVMLASGALTAQQPGGVQVPRSVLERYTGEYDQNGTTIKVILRGDTLLREVPGQRVVLVPITENLFRMGPVFTAEFVTDAAGRMTQVVTDGVMVEFRLPRKGARAPAGSASAGSSEPVRVPRSVLEQYVGTYEYLPGQMGRTDLRVVIRLKGDTLFRSVGGPQDQVLTPVSETRFRVRDSSLVTEFVIDDAGVTQVMGSGFQQLLARRIQR